jgi:hypothetical protein
VKAHDNRERFAGEVEQWEKGYLRSRQGYRLFERSSARRLSEDVRNKQEWLRRSVEYALAARRLID